MVGFIFLSLGSLLSVSCYNLCLPPQIPILLEMEGPLFSFSLLCHFRYLKICCYNPPHHCSLLSLPLFLLFSCQCIFYSIFDFVQKYTDFSITNDEKQNLDFVSSCNFFTDHSVHRFFFAYLVARKAVKQLCSQYSPYFLG